MYRYFLLFCLFLIAINCESYGQQNSTLFFMHSTPQANFVNPAVRNECNWIIGLPVISSLHFNYGNSAFSINQVLSKQQGNRYVFNGDAVLKKLGNINFLSTELHTNLFYLGFWIKENFITFSINEKADLFLTYPRDLFALGWQGNTQFEGKTAKLSHTGAFLNYRREFAIGLARQTSNDLAWGIRAKLLFGKLNTSMSKSNIDLYTEPLTYNLDFTSNWQLNTSLPLTVNKNANNNFDSFTSTGTLGNILFNRKNIGLAFDLGFIKYRDDKVTVSGSILDLGLIYWTSNGNSFSQTGNYSYKGPLIDTINVGNYFDDLFNGVKNQFGIKVDNKSYVTLLSPMVYLGATYNIKEDLNVGFLLSSKINRYRITAGATLSLNKTFNKKASVSLSYSYIYRDFKNIGAGVKLGKKPVQFYAVSDNILGFIKPLDTRNLNLRFGLQINFGCNRKELAKGCGCYWINQAQQSRTRINKLLKSNKEQ